MFTFKVLHQNPDKENGEALEQASQGSCRCPIPEGVQDQLRWGSELPSLMEGIPDYGRGLEWDDRQGYPLPTQTIWILWMEHVSLIRDNMTAILELTQEP